MRIKKITFRMNNDFSAILVCEHCGGTQELNSGYEDTYYHREVLPQIKCETCGKDREGLEDKKSNQVYI